MKQRAINKIDAQLTMRKIDLKQTESDKENAIGFITEEQYESLIEHHKQDIKVLEYILNKIR
jgi:hypothetical protein